ncbi:hypothetical protein CY91_02485 [Dehalococcoides mccartyi]|uniref:hypothetical protein n=1 Tax=Dehalococcoides mccartyi TaxID=61435 RepID=UPI0005A82791|nr:hypothetical protein [Dehalococcoides mccartyi]KSV17885.1 hypothetical protein CY91_02485 [Dehalococcoides mccartyi]
MESEKAKALYNQIVESYRLPDVKEAFEILDMEMPQGKELLDKVNKHTSNGKHLWSGLSNRLAPKYLRIFKPWLDIRKNKFRSKDFKYWFDSMQELIKYGFNRGDDIKNNRCKITGKSEWLFLAIFMRSYAEHSKIMIKEWEEHKILQYGGKIYDFSKILTDLNTGRLHRQLVKRYKESGYILRHDEKIIQTATRWYYSRVKYSGPKEFCDKMKGKEFTFDPSNISNEIKLCDEAMGYPRKD